MQADDERLDDFEEYKAIKEFITTFDTPKTLDFWQTLIIEEAMEFLNAEEPVNILKEYCDLQYVTGGQIVTADILGLSPVDITNIQTRASTTLLRECAMRLEEVIIPYYNDNIIKEAFLRIHKSNMSKVGDDGKPLRNENGKILKGPNYIPPTLDDLVPVEAYHIKKPYYSH